MTAKTMLFGVTGPYVDTSGIPVAFTATAAPAGGWTWFNGPCAVHSGTKTYVGYVKGSNGDVCARTIDDDTLTVSSESVMYPLFEVDDHAAPGMLIRASDGYVCATFSTHVGDLYFITGSSAGALPAYPTNITNITSQVGTRSGSAGYTYPHLVQFSAEANTLYIFFRWHDSGGTAYLAYTKSTDNGATWAARVNVLQMTYHQLVVSGTDRVDFVASPPLQDDAGPHSIYHFYKQGANYYKSDGTQIMTALPLTASDLTLVYDGSGAPDDAWLHDIAMNGSNPVITYVTFPAMTDHRYIYARWTGSAWSSNPIAAGGSYIVTSIVSGGSSLSTSFSGGVVLDRTTPTTVWCSIQAGASEWDIWRYTTTDGGSSWTSAPITSSGKNIRPVAVQSYDDSVQVLWMEGTYANYKEWSTGTKGAGT